MSEPSRWGPPGFDAASGPTVPIPTAPRPTASRPAASRPAASRPTAPYPTQRAPLPPPAARDDHGGTYRDDYGDDDRGAYRDDDRGAYRDDHPPARRRSRGQVFAGVVLLLALAVSALLGALTYQTLASADLISADPLGGLAGQAATLGVVAFGALGVFVLAVIALAVARPKVLAGIGLAASLLLPVGAVVLGVMYGGDVLRQNVENDLPTDGASAVRTVVDELKRNGLDPGPLGDLIVGIAGG